MPQKLRRAAAVLYAIISRLKGGDYYTFQGGGELGKPIHIYSSLEPLSMKAAIGEEYTKLIGK